MHYVCQKCQEARATVHITDTMPEKREWHLCEACAEKEGVIVTQHQSTSSMLQEFIKQKAGVDELEDRTCSKCGTTFRGFQSSGQLGCPHDYEAFRPLLTSLIKRAHEGATKHIGKVPNTADEAVKRQAGIQRLRRELQVAIDKEDYEHAAGVRDRIRALDDAANP